MQTHENDDSLPAKNQAKTVGPAGYKKLNIKSIFLKKRPIGGESTSQMLKDIFCPVCKHSGAKHAYKGKSEGCARCGCLATIEEIEGHYHDAERKEDINT